MYHKDIIMTIAYDVVVISPTSDNRYILKKELGYRDIVIPIGYKTNGANIPHLLWNIVPPFKPKYLPAVIVHDYLCDQKLYHKADTYFKEILYSLEYSIITRGMVLIVRLYHRFKYGVK